MIQVKEWEEAACECMLFHVTQYSVSKALWSSEVGNFERERERERERDLIRILFWLIYWKLKNNTRGGNCCVRAELYRTIENHVHW